MATFLACSGEGRREDVVQHLLRVLQVCGRGAAAGAGLHIGANILSGLASGRLQAR